ncbi:MULTISPECIES: hydrogenase maturation nickel metallochaperone HypA [Desulfitobacterium]|uniref:Hydrogenase maturation factor HypA n=1 Tax=Desulfitobacterium dehalogenans (strain ATCC 51507 / DSM 9161 / JW/IU-DC1) TaxID=756499 RepID=I4AEW4_DESDJ|nr:MULTISPECIES: hydrogenase maturation nickel metallochaperone HypA [Desulfitobacterium]AFM02499.1 hydrogenase nickel insertion protein HypA [Desulfitobacterium dehalogenans ATCC 51507]
MHEMSLMGGVFEAIEGTLAHYHVKKVLLVKLKIGQLTNAEPEALQMAFAAFAKGTVCEGAELQIELLPVRGRCRSCGEEFMVPGLVFACPACQYLGIDIIQGEELLLESLEVEE